MKKKKTAPVNTFWDSCLYFAGILSKISVCVFLFSFAYMTAVYWGQSIRSFGEFDLSEQMYYSAVLRNTLRLFEFSVFGILVFTALVNYKYDFYSKVLLVLSLVFVYGIPYFFIKYTSETDFKNIPFLYEIIRVYSFMGKIVLCEAVILCIRDLICEIRDAMLKMQVTNQNRKKAFKRNKGKISLGYHCWDTGLCPKEIRDSCPAFLTKKNCWKMKIGCCDPTLFLIYSDSKYAKKLLKENKLLGMQTEISPETCKKCQIYLVHQRKKYKVLLPAVIMLSLGFGVVIYKSLWTFFEKAIISVDKFANFLIPHSNSIETLQTPLFVLSAALVGGAIILIISIMVQILHYFVFKLKI